MQLVIDDIAEISTLTEQGKAYFTSGKADLVGRALHESLLNQLRRGQEPLGSMIGVTDKRVLLCHINAQTHDERAELARNAGRAFAASSYDQDEELLFIGCCSVGIGRSDDSEYAFTFVQDLADLRAATSRDELADAFQSAEVRVFLDELRDSAVVDTVTDGSLSVSEEVYMSLSDADKVGKTTARNFLLAETMIGSITSLPFVKAGGLSEDSETTS